jgi:hypothetical protein
MPRVRRRPSIGRVEPSATDAMGVGVGVGVGIDATDAEPGEELAKEPHG